MAYCCAAHLQTPVAFLSNRTGGWAVRSGERVEVFNGYSDAWVDGFEIIETVATGIRIRRVSDGSVLPIPIGSNHVRRPGATGLMAPEQSEPVDQRRDDGLLAGTVAHALLQSMTVISELSAALTSGDVVTPEWRTALTNILHHAEHVSGVLVDLVRGLPVTARAALDELPA